MPIGSMRAPLSINDTERDDSVFTSQIMSKSKVQKWRRGGCDLLAVNIGTFSLSTNMTL